MKVPQFLEALVRGTLGDTPDVKPGGTDEVLASRLAASFGKAVRLPCAVSVPYTGSVFLRPYQEKPSLFH
ncbi:Ig kappa chain V-III region CBPC 101 [Clarias magur]|uniref:Ig kappa chain V-III region CBPC 101 n=1 Tax=Clarias magur TaxID=1594786 RepID=A0A8J4UCG7_CLAMG|nr:Ig kappa chain V-III region CBPC 101 [Clarias magur]